MAHYTIFELERIEKVLEAKLSAAREVYKEREGVLRAQFKADVFGNHPAPTDIDEVKIVNESWAEYKTDDMDLMLLAGEVDLFERGINALYSYWNSAVEIFIDNMREKTEERVKQP